MKRTLSLLSFILLLCAVFIFVSCSEIEFKVDFVVDDELYATVRTNGGETIRMPTDPDKEGYIFEGWYWDLYSWNQPFTANSLLDAPLSSNMTVYAKWRSVNSLTLIGTEATFDTFEKTSDTQYYLCVPNDTETMPLDPLVSVARGSTWALSFDVYGNQTIASRTVTLNEGDNTYYALVEAENGSKCLYTLSIRRRPMYTVEYELPFGVFAAPCRVEEGTVVTPPALSRVGYDFVAWSYDFTQPIMQSQIVTTTWQAKQYTVTYDACGGTVSSPFFTATYRSRFSLATPTREGYVFEGWYYDSKRVIDGTWTYDANVTLQAQWTLMLYGINISLGGGVLAQTPPTTYTMDSDTITIGAPTRTDYIFLGWTGTDISTPTQTITIPKGSTGHKNYTATWRYDGYEIHYVLNGGQNHASNPAGYTDSSGTITLYAPTRTGYIFGGWYTDPACTSGLEISAIPQGSVGEVTVYAKWMPISYTIVFDQNAGSATGVMADQSFSYDQQQALLENAFERRGYRFVGWCLRADGIGNSYTDGEIVSNLSHEADAVVTLYAQWEALSYTVTLDHQAGIGSAGSVTVTYDGEMPDVLAPTRTGYVFLGYFTTTDGGVKYYNADMSSARIWDKTENVTLYAQWEPVSVTGTLSDMLDAATHTVSFNLNGAGGTAPAAQNVTNTVGLVYPAIPTRSGYVFAGWYTDAACTGSPYNFAASVDGDVTLYAKWVEPSYSYTKVLTVGSDTGSTSFGSAIKYYPFISLVDQTVTIYTTHTSGDPKIYLYNANRSQLAYDDDGGEGTDSQITYTVTAGALYYVGFGCYGSSSGTGCLYITGTTAPEAGGLGVGTAPATYTLTYGESFTLPVPTKSGYIFAGWYDGVGGTGTRYTDETGSSVRTWDKDSNATLYAKWTAMASITATVTFDKQSGTGGTDSVTATYGSAMPAATAPTRTGYTFMGYFTAAVGGTQYYNADMTSAREFDRLELITLYAQWTVKTVTGTLVGMQGAASHTVSFDLNGASGTAPEAQTVTATVGLTYPALPARSGYAFAGWYANAACTGDLYDFSADVTENITLYAKWVSISSSASAIVYGDNTIQIIGGSADQYFAFVALTTGTITVNVGKEAWIGLTTSVTQSGSHAYGSISCTVTAGTLYYIHLESHGQSSGSSYIGTTYLNITGQITPTAGGVATGVSFATEQLTYGESFALPVPTNPGFIFVGWYDGVDGTGTQYTDATGVSIRTWDKEEDTTLYAKWTAMASITATVTFDKQNGTGGTNSVTATYGSAMPTATAPTRTGYIFMGYFTAAVGGTQYYNADMTSARDLDLPEDVTLYAQWTAKTVIGTLNGLQGADSYTVSFDLNGAAGTAPNAQTVTVSAGLTYPAIPTRSDYVFAGWYTDVACTGTPYDFSANVTGNVTLYAKWIAHSGAGVIPTNGSEYQLYVPSGSNDYYYAFVPLVTGTVSYHTVQYQNHRVELCDSSKNEMGLWSNAVSGNATLTAGTLYYLKYSTSSSSHSITITLSAATPTAGGMISGVFTATQPLTYGESFTLPVPTNPGFIFAGWYDGVDGTGTQYTDATGVGVRAWDKEEDTTLYAKWTVDASFSSEITFDKQGGTGGTDSVTAIYGSAMPTATAPTRTGWNFMGYFTAAVNGTKYYNADMTSAREFDLSEDVTLYAQWTPKTVIATLDGQQGPSSYTVSFDLNGATGTAPNAQIVTASAGLTYPAIPTRSGYIFAGWYTDAACTGAPYDFSAEVIASVTLYAKWIMLNTSGAGNYVMDPVTYSSSSTAYRVSISGTSSDNAVYVYFVMLKSGSYSVYYRNDSSISSQRWIYNVTTGSDIKSLGGNSSSSYYSGTFSANAGDLICVQLYLGSYSTASYYYSLYVSNAQYPTAGGMISGVFTATEPITYGVSFTLPVPTNPGFIFAGWYDGVDGTGTQYTDAAGVSIRTWDKEEDTTLYAKWVVDAAVNREITFDKQGGTGGTNSVTATYGGAMPTATAPTRTGYTFMGYFTAAVGGTQYYNADMTSAREFDLPDDITLYARWEAVTVSGMLNDLQAPPAFTVSFDLNGADGTAPEAQLVTESVAVYYPTNPTRSGYVFTGWYLDASCTVLYNFSDSITADMTLYAGWSTGLISNASTYAWILSGDVLQSTNQVHGSSAAYEITAPVAMRVSFNYKVSSEQNYDYLYIKKNGSTLKSASGSTGYLSYSVDLQVGDVLSFVYSKDGSVSNNDDCAYISGLTYTSLVSYTGTAVADGVGVVTEMLTYGESFTLPVPTKIGFTFVGWYDGVGGTGKQYTDETGASVCAWDRAVDVMLYAKWEVKTVTGILSDMQGTSSYTVSFDLNGATGTAPVAQTVTASTGLVYPTIPTRSGYAFAGWYTDAACTGTPYDFSADVTGNVTLYAKWGSMIASYTTRQYVDIANYASSSAKYTFSNITSSSSSSAHYYYFTCYKTGSYTLYAAYTAGDYYISAYNVTQSATVLSRINFWGSGSKSTSATFSANAGDVVYVSIYKYSDSSSTGQGTFYVTGAAYPATGGIATGLSSPSHTVSFNLNGAAGTAPVAQTVTETVGLTYPTIPTRSGYVFAGWYTDAACSGEPYDFTADVTGNITLYAKWVSYSGYGTLSVGGNSGSITFPARNTSNYRYYAFVPLVSGSITIYSSSSSDTYGYLFDASKTQIAYNDDGGTNTNFSITHTVTAGQLYYVVACAYSSSSSCTGTIYISGTVVPTAGGVATGVSSATQALTYGESFTLPVPTKPGFIFAGWYDGVDGTGTQYTDATGACVRVWDKEEDTVLYAKWTSGATVVTGTLFDLQGGEASHIVSFNLNGASGTAPEAQTVTATVGLTYPTLPTRSGYVFAGWYADAACTGTPYEFSADVTGNVILYAKWVSCSALSTAISLGNNTINIIGGSNTQHFAFVPLTSGTVSVTVEKNAYIGIYDVAPTSSHDQYATGGSYGSSTYTVTAGNVYYISLQSDRCTSDSASIGSAYLNISIEMPTAGGVATGVSSATQELICGESFTLPVPTKPGFIFAGWYDGVDGTGTQYTDATGACVRVWDKDVDTTLYAKWTSSAPVTGTANVWDGTVASAYAGGNGTLSDPYVIETGAQLAYLASCVNSGTTYGSTYFRLDNDIDLNQIEWVPIGKGSANGWAYDEDWTKYFAGTFDGNGHSILNMKQSTATYGRTGLFGLVYSGTIIDLCLEDASINVTNSVNNAVAGILIGTCKSATVSGCAVSGTIYVSHMGDNAMAIGGMIGCLNAGTITNSTCDAVVAADATDNSYNIYAGGFVGEAIGACTISYCRFDGSVSAAVTAYNVYVNGLAGIAESASASTIRNCVVTGTFSGSGVSVYADAVYYPWNSVELSVISCYYNATFVKNGTTTTSSTYGFSTALANLRSQSWLSANLGWDFDTVFAFVEGIDLPVLKAFYA